MAEIKHVGRLTTNNRKLVVAYRVVPGEPENCLVIHTESLEAADHDTLITMVESNAGQTADELSTVMARTQLTDGSYSLLVQHYVKELGGVVSHGNAEKIDVIVRVHDDDKISTDESTIVFDPWRTYPKAKNVVYYGDTKNV